MDLSPGVTGRAESIKKKWGPFVPVLPHGNKHQVLGGSTTTYCQAVFPCWDPAADNSGSMTVKRGLHLKSAGALSRLLSAAAELCKSIYRSDASYR